MTRSALFDTECGVYSIARTAAAVSGTEERTGADVVAMLRAATEGIKARGQSDLGDKTLLDAARS
ncbi:MULTISPECIES: DAK2 domain-containing protein [unclassified Cryobacterium]|uniref:DAK2 domain-containing protein n=1 Tax=unclassified Cryobacterium TaxID=2649013 RepID=UPI0018E07D69|nr:MULTISPECIES: DAK2 domain-containing protein [unclassified Cryobacterium]